MSGAEADDRPRTEKRAPASDVEVWAARVLARVAGLDPDRAASRNGVGFSKPDGEFGASLADQVAKWGRLSEKQWLHAVRLARRYRAQAADDPEPKPGAPPPADVAELRATVTAIADRLSAILGDYLPTGDHAVGMRCLRASEPGTAGHLAHRCLTCPCNPEWGEGRALANSVCKGNRLWMQARRALAGAEGDAVTVADMDDLLRAPTDADFAIDAGCVAAGLARDAHMAEIDAEVRRDAARAEIRPALVPVP